MKATDLKRWQQNADDKLAAFKEVPNAISTINKLLEKTRNNMQRFNIAAKKLKEDTDKLK